MIQTRKYYKKGLWGGPENIHTPGSGAKSVYYYINYSLAL